MVHMEAPPLHVTRELLAELSAANPNARLERARDGTLIVMPPCGIATAIRHSELVGQLAAWNKRSGLGYAVESAGGYELPDGAILEPDASWIEKARFEALSTEEREGFSPICPDFVVEMRSPSDRLSSLRKKMEEYRENGARLGWLIDPPSKRVEIYRPHCETEIVEAPATLSGEDVLPGFVLELGPIFSA